MEHQPVAAGRGPAGAHPAVPSRRPAVRRGDRPAPLAALRLAAGRRERPDRTAARPCGRRRLCVQCSAVAVQRLPGRGGKAL